MELRLSIERKKLAHNNQTKIEIDTVQNTIDYYNRQVFTAHSIYY